jgi:hypothetical protein
MLFFLLLLSFSACEKYLEEKPQKTLLEFKSLDDIQLLLNQYVVMNQRGPRQPEPAADNFVLSWAEYEKYSDFDRPYYNWDPEAIANNGDWTTYQTILNVNLALKKLNEDILPGKDQNLWNRLKGAALFFRAFSFHQLVEVYAMPYDEVTADTDLGIPLRLDPDVNYHTPRATVQQTFDQIIQDLTEAAGLLPDVAEHETQPGKAAVYALLSRVYLIMRNYPLALTNATSALEIQNSLLDFNGLAFFTQFDNPEVLFYNNVNASMIVYYSGVVDSDLYASYIADAADLRPALFFNETTKGHQIKGAYTGGYWNMFNGLAVDEVYLTRAECYARNNEKDKALADLNTLLEKRFDNTLFVARTAADKDAALALILVERRKELINRGIRWSDIRRLNKEGANYTLRRTFVDNPTVIELPPNDLRYAFLIPQDVIDLGGYKQNPR